MSARDPGRVVGVVPAAGASRRMGRPKGLLELGGATFASQVVTALRDGGCDPVFFVVEDGDDALADAAREAGARILANPSPGEGPITSLRIALSELTEDTDALVYLPVDHALVRAGHVRWLIEGARAARADLALPVHDGKRGHPAFFGRALFAELADPSLEGGARTIVHRHLDRACLLTCDDPAVITDIDTPDAYRSALGRGGASPFDDANPDRGVR